MPELQDLLNEEEETSIQELEEENQDNPLETEEAEESKETEESEESDKSEELDESEEEDDGPEILDGFEDADSDDGEEDEEEDFGEHTDYVMSLRKKVEELESKSSESPYKSKLAEKIDKLLDSGKKIDRRVLEYSSIDFDKVDTSSEKSAKALIIEDMVVNKGVSQEDAKRAVNARYRDLEEYEEDSEEYKTALSLLRIDANESKGRLKEYQKEIALPFEESEKEVQERIESQKREEEEYTKAATAAISNKKGILLEVGGKKLRYKGDPDVMKEVHKIVTSPSAQEAFFERYLNDEDEVDFDKLYEDMTFLMHRDKLPGLIDKQSANIAVAKALSEELDNADLGKRGRGRRKSGKDDSEKTNEELIGESLEKAFLG